MGYKIDEIQGIGPAFKAKLAEARIKTTEGLLEACCEPAGRKTIAERTGLNEKQLLEWSNMADMMRISGVGPQFAELLEASGVDTVKELRHRNAENLASKMTEVNAEKKLAKTAPASSTVQGWVDQARSLKPQIKH